MEVLMKANSLRDSPFWANLFRLVSLKELLMQFASDEFQFGAFANLCYFLGILDPHQMTPSNRAQIIVICENGLTVMEKFGFRRSAKAARDVIDILNKTYPSSNLSHYITILRQALMFELESTVFIPVDASLARFYREPLRDWEEVIARFGGAISDIEEANKCYALGRYAAAVFHSLQVVEHGLLALGVFMNVTDPKSGFTAVANELERVLRKKHPDLTDFEKDNRALFEQINATVQSMKNAWRNKISHAQGKLALMHTDFSPVIAMEILTASRAFMRRLTTELP
jgi:HEPN domain-containing protein